MCSRTSSTVFPAPIHSSGAGQSMPEKHWPDTRPGEPRVGAREVEDLEDAERAAGVLRDDLLRLDPLVDDHQLAGTDLALELRADEIERTRFRGDDPVSVEPAEAKRSHSARIAEGDQLPFTQRDDGESAVQLAHR